MRTTALAMLRLATTIIIHSAAFVKALLCDERMVGETRALVQDDIDTDSLFCLIAPEYLLFRP